MLTSFVISAKTEEWLVKTMMKSETAIKQFSGSQKTNECKISVLENSMGIQKSDKLLMFIFMQEAETTTTTSWYNLRFRH